MNMNIDKRRAHISFLHSTIGEFVSETQFWDTTLICLDGMMCLSKLIGNNYNKYIQHDLLFIFSSGFWLIIILPPPP